MHGFGRFLLTTTVPDAAAGLDELLGHRRRGSARVSEAVPAAPVAPARRARVAVSLGFGAQGFVFAMILTSLDVFKDRYGIDDGTIAFVILGVCVMAGVGTVVADRIARSAGGSRAVLVRGLIVVATAVVVVSVAPSFAVLAVGFAVYGVGLGMVDSGHQHAGRHHPAPLRPLAADRLLRVVVRRRDPRHRHGRRRQRAGRRGAGRLDAPRRHGRRAERVPRGAPRRVA